MNTEYPVTFREAISRYYPGAPVEVGTGLQHALAATLTLFQPRGQILPTIY